MPQRSPWYEVGRAVILWAVLLVSATCIVMAVAGKAPVLAELEGEALLDGIESWMLAQCLGSLVVIALVLRLRLPMSWVGTGRLIGTVPLYLVFLVLWGPFAFFVYPWALGLFGVELEPQPHLEYFLSDRRGAGFWVAISTICCVGPIVEEVIYRGFLQTGLGRVWGKWVGLFVASLVFGMAHGFLIMIPIAMVGAFFGFLRDRSDGLASPCVAHMLHNTVTVIVTMHVPELFGLVYDR